MADFLSALERSPSTALRNVKASNPVLKDIFYLIPEHERMGVELPDRGSQLKRWLIDWASTKQQAQQPQEDEVRADLVIPQETSRSPTSHDTPMITVLSPCARPQRALIDSPAIASPSRTRASTSPVYSSSTHRPTPNSSHRQTSNFDDHGHSPVITSRFEAHASPYHRLTDDHALDIASPHRLIPNFDEPAIPPLLSPSSTSKRTPRPPMEGTPRAQLLLQQQLAAQQQQQDLLREQFAMQQRQQQELLDRQLQDMENKMLRTLRETHGGVSDQDFGLGSDLERDMLKRQVEELKEQCKEKDTTILKLKKLIESLMESVEDSVLEARGELTFALG